jgi:hypothetical protein
VKLIKELLFKNKMLKFNKNLSAIHSYLSGDGYVIRNPKTQKNVYYYIGFRNMNETLLSDFEKHFFEYFNVKPRRCKDGRTLVQKKELYFKLTEKFSYYSREWKLPKLNKINLKFWLRAFFDCEGWVVNIKAKDRSIGLDSVNHQGLKDIQKNLLRFNIPSKLRAKKGRDITTLQIFGKENLIQFRKEVGFLHPNKRKKLILAINSYVNYNWHFSKINLKKSLFKIMKEKTKFKKNRKKYVIRINSIKKNNLILLSKYLEKIYDIESKIYGPMENNTTSYYELHINKIIHVEKTLKILFLLPF